MAVGTAPGTVEDFDRLVSQPEHADARLEYVGGEIVEVGSNSYASEVAARILIKIGIYREANPIGRVTGAEGGYQVGDERYIPDVAFVSQARQPEPSHEAYNPVAPDLAVEVLSPSDWADVVRLKVAGYLAAGTVVWIVDPAARPVEVYVPGRTGHRLGVDDTLAGGEVLPGFALAVQDVFPA
jgi:Uma2 family endonuclease